MQDIWDMPSVGAEFLHELNPFHAEKDTKLHTTLPFRESAFFLICCGE